MFWYYSFLIQAYSIVWLLERQTSLHPNVVINSLLRHLVRIILYTPPQIAHTALQKHADLARRARTIAGCAEFFLEHNWATRIISHKSPSSVLSNFPYTACYKSLADTEIAQIRLRAPRAQRVLFLGGGPLPFSALLFADAGYSVTAVDYDTEAVSLGGKLIKRLGYEEKINIELSSAKEFSAYHEYDAIILGALVGETAKEKEDLILHIMTKSRKDTSILCRSVDDLCEFLYLAVPCIHGEVARIPAVQGKHINSLVVYSGVC